MTPQAKYVRLKRLNLTNEDLKNENLNWAFQTFFGDELTAVNRLKKFKDLQNLLAQYNISCIEELQARLDGWE